MQKIEQIVAELKKKYNEFLVVLEKDEEKNTAEINARRGWTEGFDVTFNPAENKASITAASKIKTVMMLIGLALTFGLTSIFGDSMLAAMGLGGIEAGNVVITLKILYAIPFVIFLAVSMIVMMFIAGKISPKPVELLKEVSDYIAKQGFVVEEN